MQYAYLALFIVSLLLIPLYFLCVRKRKEELWLLILIICVSVVNLGYLLISLSPTINYALLSNKVVYLGHVDIRESYEDEYGYYPADFWVDDPQYSYPDGEINITGLENTDEDLEEGSGVILGPVEDIVE